jgi:rubredoxin
MILQIQFWEDFSMAIYVCQLCGYEYDPKNGDPENGIAEGTEFEDLPEDFACPLCGAGKEDFEKVKGEDD